MFRRKVSAGKISLERKPSQKMYDAVMKVCDVKAKRMHLEETDGEALRKYIARRKVEPVMLRKLLLGENEAARIEDIKSKRVAQRKASNAAKREQGKKN